MSDHSRRTTLKLGISALVVGPSVVFSRTVHAADELPGGFSAGRFMVKLAGSEAVAGVTAVDLGTVSAKRMPEGVFKFFDFSTIKLTFDPKSSQAMTLKFSPWIVRNRKGSGKAEKVAPDTKLEISVSLVEDGGSPAITYVASDARPIAVETAADGSQTIEFDVASIAVVTHAQLNRTRQKELLTLSFKADLSDDLRVSGLSMSKAVYDWIAITQNGITIDGLDKFGQDKEKGGLVSKVSLVSFVTSDRPPSAIIGPELTAPAANKVKFWTPQGGAAAPKKSLRFDRGQLMSIDLPKLQVGSDALVTETLHFKVDPSSGG